MAGTSGGCETAGAAYERAALAESVRGEEAALPLYRHAVELDPAHAEANFALGRLLAAQGELEGVERLEAAMKADRELLFGGCALITRFWEERGEHGRAVPYRERMNRLLESMAAASAERAVLRVGDRLFSHGLPAVEVATLAGQLAGYPQVGAAHLVKKEVPPLPPMYVLAIAPRVHLRTAGYYQRLCQRLAGEVKFPGAAMVVCLATLPKELRQEIRLTPDAEIYRRQRRVSARRMP